REREEVPVVGPDLPRAVLDRRQRNLQVEDARSLDVAVDGERQKAVGEARPWLPELSPAALHEGQQEGGGVGWRRRASRRGGMGSHAPELGEARQGDPPSRIVVGPPLEPSARRPVFGSPGPVGAYP